MHHFKYKHNHLYCEGVSVQAIAEKLGTPAYVYSFQTIVDHYQRLVQAFRTIAPLICYSMKANSNLAVLRTLVDAGAGIDVVSGGELFKALRAGCDPQRIVFASAGKTEAEIREALRVGILLLNVESAEELHVIERVASQMGKTASVALRVNPDVAANTHAYITTGSHQHKFGMDFATAEAVCQQAAQYPHVTIRGLHVHIGSQITTAAPFVAAMTRVAAFMQQLSKAGVTLDYLDIGGGLGVIYREEDAPQTAREFAHAVLPILKKLNVQVILEPGRFIMGNAGILLTRVLYVKRTPQKNFIIVDAGMNDLLRPALYGAYHEIQPAVRRTQADTIVADVVGPVCETGDAFATERTLPTPQAGDLLCIMSTGAYGFSMASHYNSRPHPPEVMVRGQHYFVVRRREKHHDLIRHEMVPQELWT